MIPGVENVSEGALTTLSNDSKTTIKPFVKAVNKTYGHPYKQSEKGVGKEGERSDGFLGFLGSIGFALTLGRKNGLNLRIGPNIEDDFDEDDDEYIRRVSRRKTRRPSMTANESPTKTEDAGDLSPSTTEGITASDDIEPSIFEQFIKPIVNVQPRSGIQKHDDQVEHPTVFAIIDARRVTLLEGKPFFLLPVPAKYDVMPVLIDPNLSRYHMTSTSTLPSTKHDIFDPIMTKPVSSLKAPEESQTPPLETPEATTSHQ